MTAFISPVVTAFDAEGELDIAATCAVIDRAVGAGLDGVLVMGSAGEFFTLTPAERDALAAAAVETVAGRARTIIGTGACSTREAVAVSRRAAEAGANEIMVVSPYYFTLDEQTLEDHYRAIADAVDVAVHLYNFPQRTGHDLSPRLVRRLAEQCPNIRGLKDTVVDPGHTRAVLAEVADIDGFEVFSGFDIQFALNHLMGGAGAIAALSNVWPELCVAWRDAVVASDAGEQSRLQRVIDLAVGLYEVAPVFIGAIKQAMIQRGVALTAVTRTARALTDDEQAAVARIVGEVDALRG